jgi:hypothetical protein
MNKVVTLLELVKRKLTEFIHEINISNETSTKNGKLIKESCITVRFIFSEEFASKNELAIQGKFYLIILYRFIAQ